MDRRFLKVQIQRQSDFTIGLMNCCIKFLWIRKFNGNQMVAEKIILMGRSANVHLLIALKSRNIKQLMEQLGMNFTD